jgi:hypothetical protein
MGLQEDEFDDFVEDEPAPAGGTRRLLIIVLSVGCVALAISNVVLAMRVAQLRRAPAVERSPAPEAAATVPTPTMPMSEPAAAEPPLTAPTVTAPPSSSVVPPSSVAMPPSSQASPPRSGAMERRQTSESPAPAASVTTPAPAEPAVRPRREIAAPGPERAPSSDLPPRRSPGEEARVAAVTRATERLAPAPTTSERGTPERATATWMVQEYGRADAEHRARAVADFYGAHSPDGAYWRRVLAEIAGRR